MKKNILLNFFTPIRLILISYIITMLVFSFLFYMPIFHLEGVSLTYSEALFTSVSAVSVTGLSVINVSETFNYFGIFILALAIQLGGIGIMGLGASIWLVMGKKINLSQRIMIMVDQNQNTFSGVVGLIKGILILALCIEIIGAIILGAYYTNYFDSIGEAFYQGSFASLSAFTNAGFDITGESLIPFANDYFVQFVTIILICSGAIGFPVIMEFKDYLIYKRKKLKFKFSLFFKIATVSYLVIFIIGVLGIWALEFNYYYVGLEWHQQLFYSLFNSATARSGGLAIIDMSDFTVATLLFISGLMIIGASPSSVGGGIRTTTLAIMFLTLKSFAQGKNEVFIFGREIHQEDIRKSFIVISFFITMLFSSVILISMFETNNDISLLSIIFEVSSAFGTCGLSLGITSQLTLPSKLILMLLMFIGRVGLVAFLFSLKRKDNSSHYRYPVERVLIG